MSDTPAGLRRKIDRADELRTVVRTMKALAASSIGQYERSVRALEGYNQTVERGLGACFRALGPAPSAPDRPEVGRVGAVVIGSDQGLVGPFNETVVEFAAAALADLPPDPEVWVVGARADALLSEARLPVKERFVVPGSVQGIAPLVGRLLLACETRHSEGAISELHLFANRPTAGALYAPARQRLLPLDTGWQRALAAQGWPTRTVPEVRGEVAATLAALVREYLFVSLFRACAESLASENASRLAAMQRAEKNIEELLDDLGEAYHRLRQSRIDEELFDVLSGFEAIDGEPK